MPVAVPLTLTLKDARLLRSFIAAADGSGGLQPLDDAIDVAAVGIRGRAADGTVTAVSVRV